MKNQKEEKKAAAEEISLNEQRADAKKREDEQNDLLSYMNSVVSEPWAKGNTHLREYVGKQSNVSLKEYKFDSKKNLGF
jgi:hypothetical protein